MADQTVTGNCAKHKSPSSIQEIITNHDPARQLPGDRIESISQKVNFIAGSLCALKKLKSFKTEGIKPDMLSGLGLLLDDLGGEFRAAITDIDHGRAGKDVDAFAASLPDDEELPEDSLKTASERLKAAADAVEAARVKDGFKLRAVKLDENTETNQCLELEGVEIDLFGVVIELLNATIGVKREQEYYQAIG